jgi:hypothetical protein
MTPSGYYPFAEETGTFWDKQQAEGFNVASLNSLQSKIKLSLFLHQDRLPVLQGKQ